MMAGRHGGDGKSHVKARRGKHRKGRARRQERFVWLGAGAVTLGVGAALASGSGIAHADATGGDSAGSSSSSASGAAGNGDAASNAGAASQESPGQSVGAPATALSATGDGEAETSTDGDAVSSIGVAGDSPATSVSSSGGALTSKKVTSEALKSSGEEEAEDVTTSGQTTVEPGKTVVAQSEPESQTDDGAPAAPGALSAAVAVSANRETVVTEGGIVAASAAAETAQAAAEASPAEPTLSDVTDLGGNPLYVSTTENGKQIFVLAGVATPQGMPGVGLIQIDTETGERTTTIVATTQPTGMTATPDGRYVYIGRAENVNGVVVQSIVVYDSQTKSVVGQPITVAGDYPQPGHFLVSADGKQVYVTAVNIAGGSITGEISVIDTATNTVTKTIPVGFPIYSGMNPDGDRIYVSSMGLNQAQTGPGYTITVINTRTNTVERTIDVTDVGYPAEVAVSPDNKRFYILTPSTTEGNTTGLTLKAVDAATGRVLWTMEDIGNVTGSLGQRGRLMVLSPDGQRLYFRGASITAIDIKTQTYVGDPVILTDVVSGHYDLALSADGKNLYLAALTGEFGNEGVLLTFDTNYIDGSGAAPGTGGGGLSVIAYQAGRFANQLIQFALQYQRVAPELANKLIGLAFDSLNVVTSGYKYHVQRVNASTKAVFDALGDVTKQAVFAGYAAAIDLGQDLVSRPYQVLQSVIRVVAPVLRVAAPILTAISVAEAIQAAQELASAQNVNEAVEAGVDLVAAAAPVVGLGVGFVVGGPLGAAVGGLIGSGVGLLLGLAGG